jgi:hypothetical protein
MKKVTFLTAIFLVATLGCYAQKVTQGSVNFLKAGDQLHVVLNYDDLKIQKTPEKEYLAAKGEEWTGQWEKAKAETFGIKFIEFLEKNVNAKKELLVCGNLPNAPYKALVRVLSIDREWNVTCEVVFTQTGDSTPLAKLNLQGVSRTVYGIGAPSYLTGTSLGYAGQFLGKFLAGKIK